MSDLTNYLEDQVVRWISQNEDMPVSPSNIYISLHTSDEGESPDGSFEVDASDYSRIQTSPSDWSVESANGATRFTNATVLSFGDPTSNWGEVTHVGVWDGSSDTDNPLLFGPLPSSQNINEDQDEVRYEEGDFNFDLD